MKSILISSFVRLKKLVDRYQFLYMLLIVIVGCSLVFFRYLEVPKNLAFDETEFARLALSLDHQPYQVYTELATGHSTLYFYIILLSFKIFGVNNFALRIPSAIFGILGSIMFFYLMKIVFKKYWLAFFLGLTLVGLRWYLNFERFSFEATFLLFLELIGLVSITLYDQTNKKLYLVSSALFSGLAFLSYYPGRIYFLVPLFLLLFKKRRADVLIYITVLLVTITPLLSYLFLHSDIRVNQLSILSNTSLSTGQKIHEISLNIYKIILSFNISGDLNGRHNFPGKPTFNIVHGIFFIFGIILALSQLRNKYTLVFLLYFFLSLAPSLIVNSSENPNILRMFTAIPSALYFMGLSLQFLSNKLSKKNPLLFAIVLIIFTLSPLYGIRTYFIYQSRVVRNSFEITCDIQTVLRYKSTRIPQSCRVNSNMF